MCSPLNRQTFNIRKHSKPGLFDRLDSRRFLDKMVAISSKIFVNGDVLELDHISPFKIKMRLDFLSPLCCSPMNRNVCFGFAVK